MKLKFWVDVSRGEEIIDVKDLTGYTDEEWEQLSERDKDAIVYDWVISKLSYGFESVE